MNARVYDSDIGRFLSADSIVQDPLDSQAFNRYSYVCNNPMMYTDPSGHFWGIGKWWQEHVVRPITNSAVGRAIVGVVVIAVGAYVSTFNPALGSGLISFGGSIINYDPQNSHSSIGTTFSIPTNGFGTGTSETDRVKDLQEASDNIDRANAGVAPVSGAPVNNDKYANGVATESHSNANDSIATTNSNVDATLTITLKAPSPSTGFEWVGDALHIGYELLTYFPVFGAVDVLVQYGYGKIGGYTALGLLGLNLIPGGKVGGKAYRYGFSKTEELFIHFEKHGGDIMKGLNRTDYNINNYLDDANYVIRNGQYLPEMNGYVNFMGKDGKANYGFVGMTRDGKNITTFGVRNANGLKGL